MCGPSKKPMRDIFGNEAPPCPPEQAEAQAQQIFYRLLDETILWPKTKGDDE